MAFKDNKARLLASSRQYYENAERQVNAVDNMSEEEIVDLMNSNPDLGEMEGMRSISDTSTDGLIVNLNLQNNNQHQSVENGGSISFVPPWNPGGADSAPWEMNFSTQQQSPNRVSLFQLGSSPSSGITFVGNNTGYNGGAVRQDDERIKKYTNGMKLYNINPFNFYTADQMVGFYEKLEEERKHQCDQQYGWYSIAARFSGDPEMIKKAESFKFKSADEIYAEREKAAIEAQQHQTESYENDGNGIVYGVYDCNGVRYQKAIHIRVRNRKTGEIEFESNYKKDANGQSYEIKTRVDDRRRAYELQEMSNMEAHARRQIELSRKLFTEDYINGRGKWYKWEQQGLTRQEMFNILEDQRVDWKKNALLIQRALQSASFSKDNFKNILASCCATDLKYSNRSDFFSLSYDFERDLHYKTLISTPEEMDSDPLVHQKLQEEYDIKRKIFMDKVMSGNLGCQTATDAHYHPTFAKTPIHELTLEDYKKPENQVMYTSICTPEIATENVFIPKELSNPDISNNYVPEQQKKDDETPPPPPKTYSNTSDESIFGEAIDLDIDPNTMSDEELAEYF